MIEKSLLLKMYAEYDLMLVRAKRSFDRYIFTSVTSDVKEERACAIIRYCMEHYLRWTPEQMALHLNRDVLKHWGLYAISKHIRQPKEMHKMANYWWIAHKCYPNRIVASEDRVYLAVYEQFLAGNISRLPPEFFSGENQQLYVAGCLVYLLNTRRPIPFASPTDLYEFALSPHVMKFLKRYRLYQPLRIAFDGNPVDLFHMALGPDGNHKQYHYYRYLFLYRETLRREQEMRGAPRLERHLKTPLCDHYSSQNLLNAASVPQMASPKPDGTTEGP